jgi:hypothetical protein
MSGMVTDVERRKAAFLYEYRALCRKHGLMVIYIARSDDEYSPFSLAYLDGATLDRAVLEMNLEPCRKISQEAP